MTRWVPRTGHRCSDWALFAAALGLALASSGHWAAAGDPTPPPTPQRPPGFVDPAPIIAMKGPSDQKVEVLIEGPLLRAVAQSLTEEDPPLAEYLRKLTLINSVVLTVADEPQVEAARALIGRMLTALQHEGWQRLAQIEDAGVQINALVHPVKESDQIDGLLVLSLEHRRFIFSNLAGDVDLPRLSRLRGTLGIPGLDRLPDPASAAPGAPAPHQPPAEPATGPTRPPTSGGGGGAYDSDSPQEGGHGE